MTHPRERLAELARRAHGSEQLALAKVGAVLAQFYSDGNLRAAEIRELLPAVDLERSVQTYTHVKWLLHSQSHDGSRVWLHQYLDSGADELYASSTHNHRYPFVSILLAGAYTEWSWQSPDAPTSSAHEVTYSAGDINTVSSRQVHKLRHVSPETWTLVVQFPKVRSYSTVFALDSDFLRPLRTIPDLGTRLSTAIDSLGA